MTMVAIGNRMGVRMYRRLGGRMMGGTPDAPVVLLTIVGRRTGQLHSTCVRAIRHEGGYLVWGSASGAPRDPDWFRNLRKAGRAELQDGRQVVTVDAVELLGDVRDQVWRDVVLARLPKVARYAHKAGRTIPVARLTPVG